MVTDVTGMLMT